MKAAEEKWTVNWKGGLNLGVKFILNLQLSKLKSIFFSVPIPGEEETGMQSWEESDTGGENICAQKTPGGMTAMDSRTFQGITVPSWYSKCEFWFSTFHGKMHCNFPDCLIPFS